MDPRSVLLWGGDRSCQCLYLGHQVLRPWVPRGSQEPWKVLELGQHVHLLQLQPEQLDCGAAHLQHPLTILQPLKATPVFRALGLTAVAVASANNYTAVFLGTTTGRLLKVGWLHGVLKLDRPVPGYLGSATGQLYELSLSFLICGRLEAVTGLSCGRAITWQNRALWGSFSPV